MSEHAGPKPTPARPSAAQRVQTKLHVSEPGDAQEREADAVASHIVSGSRATASLAVNHGVPAANRKPVEERTPAASGAPVHRAAREPKEVHRATREPSDVHRATRSDSDVHRATREAASGSVQRASGSPVTDAHHEAAASAIANKGSGKPLDPAVRGPIERGLGANLGGVRVHDDAHAHASADDLDARAFTHGSDIWLGEGESGTDLGLMAHEATHVVQQGAAPVDDGDGAVERMTKDEHPVARAVKNEHAVARATKDEHSVARMAADEGVSRAKKPKTPKKPAPESPPVEAKELAQIDHDNKTILLPLISLPAKGNKATPLAGGTKAFSGKIDIPKTPEERGDQRGKWQSEIKGPGVDKMVDDKISKEGKGEKQKNGTEIFVLEVDGHDKSVIVGDRQRIKEQVKLPNWTRDKDTNFFFDVDHILELQLGGKDKTDNYQLLFFSANRSSGSNIKAEIRKRLRRGLFGAEKNGKAWKPNLDKLPRDYQVTFTTFDTKLPMKDEGKAEPRKVFTFDQIANKGEQLPALKFVSVKDAKKRGLLGSESELAIYKVTSAGKPYPHPIPASGKSTKRYENWLGINGYTLTSFNYEPGKGAKIDGELFKDNKVLKDVTLQLDLDEITDNTLAFRESTLKARMRKLLDAKGASPIEIYEVGLLDKGFGARGVLRPTLPFLASDLEIDITLAGEELTLSKTFSPDEISLPSPISVPDASVTLSVSSSGRLDLTGDATIVIEGVATGTIHAFAGTSGLGIKGDIDFDSEFFDPASVHLAYEKGEFSAKGELGIGPGKVRGIKSGRVTVSYEKGTFAATGVVEPSIPGVQKASLGAQFSEKEGLIISGQVALANAPGISSGSLDVVLKKPPGAEKWNVHAAGTAVPAIPGVASTLSVTYDDGALTVHGSAEYSRGMLSGSLSVGVTNREFDPSGQPTDKIGDKLRVFGGGTVTARLSPWLEGKVGVRFLPNGEIELTGRIGLPSALQVFPAKTLKKNVFSLNIDIPILGFSVLGQRVGIFATIGGGLDLSAGIGPGELRDLGLEITYNPAHEDQTHVTGGARLVIPANAGLRLFIKGALGAGIPIVSAELGLEVGAAIGLEGAAEASVVVDWSPKTGITLDALGQIYVQPKFRFDLTGFLEVTADLLFKTLHLYEKRWELAAFEAGPNLRFGVRFPVHYHEGEPFDISWDQVQFDVPDIDTKALLGDIIDRII